jgi:hypothetical protein
LDVSIAHISIIVLALALWDNCHFNIPTKAKNNMRSIGALALAVAPLLLVARADVELDGDDVPRECQSICRPLVELSRRCDASDRFDNDDRAEDEYEKHEDHLRAQCFCSNDSFDVGMITAFCGDCIRQNERRDDDDDDDNDISDEIEGE